MTIDVTTENAVNVAAHNDGPDCSVLSPERQVNTTLVFINVSLHIYEFYYQMYYSNESDDIKKIKLMNENWVTPSLEKEMRQYYPKSSDITRDPSTNDVYMGNNSISRKFRKMFPKGRQFLNYIQLNQTIQIFFKHWNLLSKGNSKAIFCSYSHIPAQKRS